MRKKLNERSRRLVLTIPEAARLLRISPGSAYLAAKGGTLPVVRVGGSIRVPWRKLELLLGLELEGDKHPQAKEVGHR